MEVTGITLEFAFVLNFDAENCLEIDQLDLNTVNSY